MTASSSSAPEASPPSTCGNCGAVVQPSDVTCPACGVLLAAYQSPSGSAATAPTASEPESPVASAATPLAVPPPAAPDAAPATSATAATPSAFSTPTFTTPSFATPQAHQPRSQSPIGDALQRPQDAAPLTARSPQDELARMAHEAGDELATMAGGDDELARMAAHDDSPLAQEIDAELAGARVTFAGSTPVIEAEPAPATPAAAPVDVTFTPAPRPAPTTPRGSVTVSTPAQRANPQPRRGVYDTPVTPEVDTGIPPGVPGWARPGALAAFLPLAFLVCFLLMFARLIPAAGGFFAVLIVITVIWGLLKWTSATSRKTTQMPKDPDWNKKKPRF